MSVTTSPRLDLAERSSAPSVQRALAATLAVIVAVLALGPGSALAGTPGDTLRGCGVLVDAAHPWHSTVPGGNVEAGDHWITARLGHHTTCAFTHVAIHRLLALPARAYQGRDVGRLLGGLCQWTDGDHHERIRPFAEIMCHLPTPRHPHADAATVRAFVDPDPRFIR